MLTQEKNIFLTGENFCSLPCQLKMTPIETKKERRNTAKKLLI
ncbi:hypothetical protein PORCAN_786 [Porphyromonas crevioricanis JCM 13913]|nr:hypothetical protein PORCAN_786 [Porphyromonas crevioricanis JCM 13913]